MFWGSDVPLVFPHHFLAPWAYVDLVNLVSSWPWIRPRPEVRLTQESTSSGVTESYFGLSNFRLSPCGVHFFHGPLDNTGVRNKLLSPEYRPAKDPGRALHSHILGAGPYIPSGRVCTTPFSRAACKSHPTRLAQNNTTMCMYPGRRGMSTGVRQGPTDRHRAGGPTWNDVCGQQPGTREVVYHSSDGRQGKGAPVPSLFRVLLR